MATTYIHGTEPSEQGRLAALNRMTNRAFVEFLDVGRATRVLEVGSGVGILAGDVAAVADEVKVIGLERSFEQIAAAARIARVSFVQGDAHQLSFRDGAFDLAYARYLLEHVADPERVLREMRRVVRAGGRVAVCENDISLLRLDPPCPTFEAVWSAFQRYQASVGGDGLIGRRLFRLFRAAGLSDITLSVQPEVHWQGSPRFVSWIENIIGNIESVREGMVAGDVCSTAEIDAAVAELREFARLPHASSHFMWNRAVGVR